MRYPRWASLFVGLGLVCACGASNGQTRPPDDGKQQATDVFNDLVAPSERVMTAAIVLHDVDGRCVKTDPLGPIYAKKGRKVQWFIQNDCGRPLNLQVTNFATKPDGKAFNPFSQPPDRCHADPGRLCTKIPTAVIGRAGPGGELGVWVFTYQIVDDKGDVIDPEIVIEWF